MCAAKDHSAQLIGSPILSAIRPLILFITFQLLPSASSRFESLGDMVAYERLRPFSGSPNGFGDPQTFFSSFFQLPYSFLLHSVHALSLTPNT
ncbi:hypothetical protein H5410_014785 [Solanum commersonii]|uniref:Uncharacterized protein n=1 Tax=Solanum commersonii TaxID=4109 RepID=A0A9J5ZRX8_SOLCO|nr:hypothetical protein H5410_014785 [Solanum commersonii]